MATLETPQINDGGSIGDLKGQFVYLFKLFIVCVI